jgi:hypothetical protein
MERKVKFLRRRIGSRWEQQVRKDVRQKERGTLGRQETKGEVWMLDEILVLIVKLISLSSFFYVVSVVV